jgi:hypothetical protein
MHRELFIRTTGEAFDPIAPARVGADVTIGFILQPDRASRMLAQNAVDPQLPGLGEVIDRLTKATFDAVAADPYEAAVRRATGRVLVDRLTWLATVAPDSQVRAVASRKLQRLSARGTAAAPPNGNELDAAHLTLIAADIKRFLERPAGTAPMNTTTAAPPGAPIGGDVPQNWLATPSWCLWDEEN